MRRLSNHRCKKPYLFEGRHTIFKTEQMPAAKAQRKEKAAVRFLHLLDYRIVNIAEPGSLGGLQELIWTENRCAVEALKYNTRAAFKRNSKSAYHSSLANRWLNDICAHMPDLKKPNGYWTKDRCAKMAIKFRSRFEFDRKCNSAYSAAVRKGWLSDICNHMVDRRWTKERCAEAALKHKTRSDFRRAVDSAYAAAWRNGWLDEICGHMPPHTRPVIFE